MKQRGEDEDRRGICVNDTRVFTPEADAFCCNLWCGTLAGSARTLCANGDIVGSPQETVPDCVKFFFPPDARTRKDEQCISPACEDRPYSCLSHGRACTPQACLFRGQMETQSHYVSPRAGAEAAKESSRRRELQRDSDRERERERERERSKPTFSPVLYRRVLTVGREMKPLSRRCENLSRHRTRRGLRWCTGYNTRLPPRRTGFESRLFSHLEIVPEDAAGRRVFSGMYRFPSPYILALLHTHFISPSSALKTSLIERRRLAERGSGTSIASDWLLREAKCPMLAREYCMLKAVHDKWSLEFCFLMVPYNAKDPNEVKDLNDIDVRDIICWKTFPVNEGSLRNFRMHESCLTIRWSAGFLGDISFYPPLHSGAAPYSPRFTIIGSQDFDRLVADTGDHTKRHPIMSHTCSMGDSDLTNSFGSVLGNKRRVCTAIVLLEEDISLEL
ncbi:hypothetical protein PR048_023023 [Dryococelus australis]|uniref:Uncharacterized protein n=1 Tax=Dryococelus australis TaxID=614101 RepID=A0ABQ9GSZ4_9NEOP|nr:hypothetical protein PR048_023023 [Dryococelus australis]